MGKASDLRGKSGTSGPDQPSAVTPLSAERQTTKPSFGNPVGGGGPANKPGIDGKPQSGGGGGGANAPVSKRPKV